MDERDDMLARRVWDVIAVVAEDIDAIHCEVEDSVAYIEGVVPDEKERRAIGNAVMQVDGLRNVITCLATEHILPMHSREEAERASLYSPPVMMHYYSLS